MMDVKCIETTIMAVKGHFPKNENAWAMMCPPTTCPLCPYSCLNVVKWCQDVTNGSVVRALTDGQTHTDTQTWPILYPRPLTRERIKSGTHNSHFVKVFTGDMSIMNFYWFLVWKGARSISVCVWQSEENRKNCLNIKGFAWDGVLLHTNHF